MSDQRLFAILTNPRDGELYEATVDEYALVRVHALKSKRNGRGFLTDEGKAPQVLSTNFMRAETAYGVNERGAGVGTVLYTALASVQAWNARYGHQFRFVVDGEGICSYDFKRSSEASAWWKRSAERGLTMRSEWEIGPDEYEVIDTYGFKSAVRHNLVIALVSGDSEKLSETKHSNIHMLDIAALEASDFAKLPNKKTVSALIMAASKAGMPLETCVKLVDEYKESRARKARKNPSGGTKRALRERLGWNKLP